MISPLSLSYSEVKKERPPTPDDVIVLSDNEPSSPCMNGITHSFKKANTEMLMVTVDVQYSAFFVVSFSAYNLISFMTEF